MHISLFIYLVPQKCIAVKKNCISNRYFLINNFCAFWRFAILHFALSLYHWALLYLRTNTNTTRFQVLQNACTNIVCTILAFKFWTGWKYWNIYVGSIDKNELITLFIKKYYCIKYQLNERKYLCATHEMAVTCS